MRRGVARYAPGAPGLARPAPHRRPPGGAGARRWRTAARVAVAEATGDPARGTATAPLAPLARRASRGAGARRSLHWLAFQASVTRLPVIIDSIARIVALGRRGGIGEDG
ncbi:MAG: hypothetical protein RMJ54_18610 [Roseiflexaceae bacterium]|nr:hypothetical protein [Roseiflexaceae bacterium]